MKNLKDKAINIKGKDYVEVCQRILYLSEKYEEKYSIETDYEFFEKLKMWVVKATLTIGECKYTGLAQEIIDDGYINKTSALENCETSAVGRACAMAGIGVIDSIASVDEINKAHAREIFKPVTQAPVLDSVTKIVCTKCGKDLIYKGNKNHNGSDYHIYECSTCPSDKDPKYKHNFWDKIKK